LQAVSDRAEGHGLPAFVEHEFRDFLRCGILAEGYTRLQSGLCVRAAPALLEFLERLTVLIPHPGVNRFIGTPPPF